jgi:hypothetical protein
MRLKNTFWKTSIKIVMVVIGIITASPILVLLDPKTTLEISYGITSTDPMVEALLMHRGIFQMILGTAIVIAAFIPKARIPVALTAAITKTSFVLLILPNEVLRGQWPTWTAIFDITSVLILLAVVAYEFSSRKNKASAAESRQTPPTHRM